MVSDEATNPIPTLAAALERAVASAFVGPRATVRIAVLGLLGGLHVLIEDIPGVGKTTLASALAKAAALRFSRIQFTPDMLPGDVLGMNVWDPTSREFVFREGPVNASFVLADELNRTSPRTQSAFLEAMQEGQITVDGKTRELPNPFFLIATQNPASFAGTFPLPEAELDRFGLSFSLGYPSKEDEIEILRKKTSNETVSPTHPVTDAASIVAAREYIDRVHVSDAAREYIVALVRKTRESPEIRLGASPRAAVFLQRAARARAAAEGRNFVLPEDAEAMAEYALAHRITLSSQARLNQIDVRRAIGNVCQSTPKPTGL